MGNITQQIAEHRERVKRSLEAAEQAKIDAEILAKQRFWASPQGQWALAEQAAQKARQEELAIKEKQRLEAAADHSAKVWKLRDAGIYVGLVITIDEQISPFTKWIYNESKSDYDSVKAYKLVLMASSDEPCWILTDNQRVHGLVTFCNDTLYPGDRMRITKKMEKSCMVERINDGT